MRTFINKSLSRYKNMPIPVKASMWFVVCSILQKCISFITVPIFTRILTTSQYGLFNVYQSWMNIIVIFATLNLQYGVFNNAMVKFEDDRDTYISSMQGLSTALTLAFFIVYLSAHNFWNSIFQLPMILMLSMFAEIFAAPALGFWSGKQRFNYSYKKLIWVTLIISFSSPILGVIVVMSTENKGVTRILSAAFINVIACSVIYIYNAMKGKKFFVKKYWKYALGFNIPLVPYYLSQMIFNQSDRLMINSICGTDKAGIYSVAYSLALILSFVLVSINNSFVPWVYKNLKEKKYKEIGEISNSISIIIASMLLLLITFAPEVIRIMAAKEYYEAIWVVPPVAASLFFLFQSQLSINIEFYFEENKFLVRASLLAAVANIVLNYIFLNFFGYIAAGYTTLISYIIFSLHNYYYMKKVCKKHLGEDVNIYNAKYLIILSIGFLIVSMLLMMLYKLIIIRYVILFIALMVIFIKRKYIITKINVISKK